MIKILKYFFFSIFLSFFIAIILALIFVPEDREWIKCSDEKDLYRYVYNGWKVDKVVKDYKGEYPQIYLSKNDRIKALNFGWRCYYLEGAELNYKTTTNLNSAIKKTYEYIKKRGYKKFDYSKFELEIKNNLTPSVWKNKEM